MRRVGNATGNEWWEARLPEDYAAPYTDRTQMESFIRAKYSERRWAGPGNPPHMQAAAPAQPVASDGRVNPAMYQGRFAHDVLALQQPVAFSRPKHPPPPAPPKPADDPNTRPKSKFARKSDADAHPRVARRTSDPPPDLKHDDISAFLFMKDRNKTRPKPRTSGEKTAVPESNPESGPAPPSDDDPSAFSFMNERPKPGSKFAKQWKPPEPAEGDSPESSAFSFLNAKPKAAPKLARPLIPDPEQTSDISAFSFMNDAPEPPSDLDGPPNPDPEQTSDASAFSFMNEPTSDLDAPPTLEPPPGSGAQSPPESEESAFSFMNETPTPTSDRPATAKPASDHAAPKPHSDRAAPPNPKPERRAPPESDASAFSFMNERAKPHPRAAPPAQPEASAFAFLNAADDDSTPSAFSFLNSPDPETAAYSFVDEPAKPEQRLPRFARPLDPKAGPKPAEKPRERRAPPRRREPPPGSTAGDILRQAEAAGRGAKKRGRMKQLEKGKIAHEIQPGMTLLDQMLAIVTGAREGRPGSAPAEPTPAGASARRGADPAFRDFLTRRQLEFRQMYPLAYPDPDYW
jgi:hypothetical protein